ncbi:hypothetical protein GCM10010965_15030 [Caldalkalibacillus thermarum]|uniref:hypothetical protein n=1 Tax=Caldalkalibacillus thermarum TaxID=296745 RepID=UPI00166D000A|nr:hypothetical protein [Caldalkalibacillus thermarum]GGK23193.1 hypothetical protein GCM10010965_15030 [Caldalkalibacillus thermarum]
MRKKWLLFSLVLVLLVTPVLELVHYQPASAAMFQFDLNSNQYGRQPNLNFKSPPTRGNITYTLHLKEIRAKTEVTAKGTQLILNLDSLFDSDPIQTGNIDIHPNRNPVPNVKQASELVMDMFEEWKKKVRQEFGVEGDVLYNDLRNMRGQVRRPKPFYYQGRAWAGIDAVEGVFRAQSGTIYLSSYSVVSENDVSEEFFVVDLRFAIYVEYDRMAIVNEQLAYFFNYYSNVILHGYSVTATKTKLNEEDSAEASGRLTILEDEDDLHFTPLGSMNRRVPNRDYNHDDWVKHRMNPGAVPNMAIPIYLFYVYVNYDEDTGRITLGREGENAVTYVRDRQNLRLTTGETQPITQRVSYKNGEYVLMVPILNALRFYEDAANPLNHRRVGRLNWPEVSEALTNEFERMMYRQFRRIVQDINRNYETNFAVNATSRELASQAREQIFQILGSHYEDKDLMHTLHVQEYSHGRIRMLTGNRLLPKSYEARKEILDIATDGWHPNERNNPQRQAYWDRKLKEAYDKHMQLEDVVDAYFGEGFRSMLAIPYKIKKPESIQIEITDTGINPKVNDISEGVGLDEYENLKNREPGQSSYALPGKEYHAKLELTNHGDFPVTNTVIRYYVVSSQPGSGKRPQVYSSGVLGMLFGDRYTFETDNGVKDVVARNARIDSNTIGTTPDVLKEFLDPDETIEVDFTWRMPTDEENPDKDPVYLFVTVGQVLDENKAMENQGTATAPNWSPMFEREMLEYIPGQAKATLIAFTPNQIMSRDEENTIDMDKHTVAIRLDVADRDQDPWQIPPEELIEAQDFLRFATITTYTEEEVPRWIEDGYWADLNRAELRYRRTQWLVE